MKGAGVLQTRNHCKTVNLTGTVDQTETETGNLTVNLTVNLTGTVGGTETETGNLTGNLTWDSNWGF